ncbi:hypothetical protein [Bacillus atrophaeus]|uniref:hypothetical protein n=1 Tax=Bacillus atrophaeus TaxID=1452 RepID=UPI001BAD8098|nr:hypothetical protein [Bacillus atrophaeus]QUF66007.1 hypothetical protein KCX77_03395 [Bacillus atrophaeus]QUF66060.1 hypothetical protein KCX77_03695 [Bacillus atrophaeus]
MSNKIDTIKHWYEKEGFVSPDDFKWLIDRTELSVKQQEEITEYKRSEEVTVNQFRQAQKDIQHLSGDRKRYKQALEKIITNLNFAITVAQNELEGDA